MSITECFQSFKSCLHPEQHSWDIYKLLKRGLYLMKEQQRSSDKSLSKCVATVGFELSDGDF